MRDRVAQWIRPAIRALSAYHVPDAGDWIKLDAMENPYRWPEWMVDAWLQRLRELPLNRYPDPSARTLASRLREVMAIPQQAGLLLGNGSDELIQMIMLAVAGPGEVILAPEPTFVMYRMIATVAGMEYVGVPLRDDFSLDGDAMLAAVDTRRPVVVYLARPNNPTGNLFDPALIRSLIERSPGLVVIDEAYAPFTDASFLGEVGQYDNLLVLRTLSKMGLAGLRLGLLVGPPAWLEEFDKTRLPYNISTLDQASGEFALRHVEVFDAQAKRIRADRSALLAALGAMPGITVYPSEANFILFRVPHGRAVKVFEALKARGVLIKNLHGSSPALQDCMRVTVGLPQENTAFAAALRQVL
jgi:histidinol-phosphate aminotransferase